MSIARAAGAAVPESGTPSGGERARLVARVLRAGTALLVVAAAVVSTRAPAQTGGLEVIVFDPGGKKPVAGVEVSLSSEEQQVAATTRTTNADGVVYFPVLRPSSRYAVRIVMKGYASQEITGIRVRIGEVTHLPIRLTPEFEERVTLRSARHDTVDIDRNETSTKFGDNFLEDLPVMGRFYQDVLKLAAGVQDANEDGNPNVHGARAVDFKTEVGGISNQDPLTGQWMSFVNPDSIEEIEILTAGAGVEYSRAQGGFANIIQKQGSNDFEGIVGMLYRTSVLEGTAAVGHAGVGLPSYRWSQPGFQISGPIVKDKLWYRLSHEIIDGGEPVDNVRSISVTTRKQQIAADQITWQVSPRNKLAFQYQADPLVRTNVGVTSLVPTEASKRLESGGPSYTLTWTAPVSPSILVDSLVSWQNGHQNILPSVAGAPNDCLQGLVNASTGDPLIPSLERAQCTNTRSGLVSGSATDSQRDDRQRLTVKSQATFYVNRFLGASHQLRLGLSMENERYFRSLERNPSLVFTTRQSSILSPTGAPVPLEIATFDATIAIPERADSRVTGATAGLYAEDMFKPARNVTVTLGLRLDNEEVRSLGYHPFDPAAESDEFLREMSSRPYYDVPIVAQQVFTAYEAIADYSRAVAQALGFRTEQISTLLSPMAISSIGWQKKRRPDDIDVSNNNLSPRLSAAWDPKGDGKSKLAFTAGRYYGTIFLGVPAVEVGPASTTVTFTASRSPGNPYWSSPAFAAGLNPAVSVQMMDRNLRTPHQNEMTLSYERELWPETSLRLTYVRRRFVDQMQTIDLNHYHYDYGTCVLQTSPFGPYIDFSRKDGIIDDCEGRFVTDSLGMTVRRPDGYADNYVYNPGWGSIFLVGNFNSARYDGLVVDLIRRQYRNWQLEASYTFSRAVGDAEEWLSPLGDDRSNLDAERGFLSYDQRHVVKVNATTITPWGFRLGTAASWMTGLPYSILATGIDYDSTPPQYFGAGSTQQRNRTRYPTGQRNDQRNRPELKINVKLDREFNLPGGQNVQLSLEVFNLLNARYYEIYNRDLELGRQVNGQNEAISTIGREYQLGLRVSF